MKKRELLQLLDSFHDEMEVTVYNSDCHEAFDIAMAIPAISSETGCLCDVENAELYSDQQPVIMLVQFGDFVETSKPFEWDDLMGLRSNDD